jgi:choline dehydrogenase-like flavoprotein
VSAEAEAPPRAKGGRAPDVFRVGGWVPMRQHADKDEVDFAVVGTGAGGGTLSARLAEMGFSVVAFDAGPFFRPLEDFASDEEEQRKLYWNDERIVDGDNPLVMGGKNSGKCVGGSTVHFAMVSLRFRPEHFKARSKLGYGADWPVDWREMWGYYDQVERALGISGPVTYPWGPPRPAYPYREMPLNACAQAMAMGCEALGLGWSPMPLATLSAPRGHSPPCVQRGFCRFGCATNAKQSALTVWIPRALKAGAEIRDLAMVGGIEIGPDGRATGVRYHREGEWRFQRARHVVVAGYAVETPRLLLNSACAAHPGGLANSSGLVGKNLMTQPNQGVFGRTERASRWNKGPPNLCVTEHWNYRDDTDFPGGYTLMSQGPMPQEWAHMLISGRGLWGEALREAMLDYNHMVGIKVVGEGLPSERNTVTLADETDALGLPIARITYSWMPEDKALIAHSLDQMQACLEAAGAKDIFRQDEDANHIHGTARMGADAKTSVVDPNGRSWDIDNLWVCDGSIFPTVGGVNPSLTIQAMALRTADRIQALAARGEL